MRTKYSIEIPCFLKKMGYIKLDIKHNPIEFVYDMDCNLLGIFFSLIRKDKLINMTVKLNLIDNTIPEVYSGIFSNDMKENFNIANGGRINFFKYFKYYKKEMFSIPVENDKLIDIGEFEIYHRFPGSFSGYRTYGDIIQKYYISFYLRQISEKNKFYSYEFNNKKIKKLINDTNPDYVTFYKAPDRNPDRFFISFYKENLGYKSAFDILERKLEKYGKY